MYKHVYGHLDEGTAFASLTLPQQLNVMADTLAKFELQRCINAASGGPPLYPLEPVRVLIGRNKVTSSIKMAIYQHWGRNVAMTLFERKHIVSRFVFPTIYWEGMNRFLSNSPQMFQTWLTKHVSGFCGTNRHLSRIDDTVVNTCPCCGHSDESVAHITRCPDPGRQTALSHAVDNLTQWLTATHTDGSMTACISAYLKSSGEGSMAEIAQPFPHLRKWAFEHDTLGWDNFLEGRIGKTLIDIQEAQLGVSDSKMHILTWASKLISHLLAITHSQWIYRNTKIHLRLVEGRTVIEHDEVMRDVLHLLATHPDDILPQHRGLLEVDMSTLGRGSTVDRQYWVAAMTSALSAAKTLPDGRVFNTSGETAPLEDQTDNIPIPGPP
jgi:hypothetical protein